MARPPTPPLPEVQQELISRLTGDKKFDDIIADLRRGHYVSCAAWCKGELTARLSKIGPVVAIPKALKLAGLKVSDIDLVELNEAFASQALYSMRELGLDAEKVNVNGGAIALGHPLACTGAKLTATLLHEMKRRGSRYGIVSMCIGGGMGAAGIYENLS